MTLIFSNASTQTEVLIRDKNGVSTPTVEGHNNVGGQSLDRDNGREKTALQPIEDEDPILRRLKPKCKEDVRLLFSELNLWRKKKLDEIETRSWRTKVQLCEAIDLLVNQ